MRTLLAERGTLAMILAGLCLSGVQRCAAAGEPHGLKFISASPDRITFTGTCGNEPLRIVELDPVAASSGKLDGPVVARVDTVNQFETSASRFDGARDRLYSGFRLVREKANAAGEAVGAVRFVEEMPGVSKFHEPFPTATSKKGLQVQMVDDALALSIKHAALNVNLAGLIDPAGGSNQPAWQVDGETHCFKPAFVEHLDRQIKPLSDAGIIISLILLNYESADPEIRRIMQHPRYDRSAPHKLGAFNTVTPEGLRWFKACIEFLADRYSRPDQRHGRAVNFIVGNEVNSHWEWANMGRVSLEEFAADYLRTLRVCHTAVRRSSTSTRVYISLEHHWGIRFDRDPAKSFPGRDFLEFLTSASRAGGDFDWHIAYHPYPENLFECRFWNDKTARPEETTPRITFKNLEVLANFLRKPEMLHHGQPRRVILSEQGFHSPATADGETLQAAAYAAAYYKVSQIEGIDSFILHRHVDHAHEGGLNLGLWTRNPAAAHPAEPLRKKRIYEIFLAADTPAWEQAFQFALPIVGVRSWREFLAGSDPSSALPKLP